MAIRVKPGDFNSFQKAIGEIQSKVDANQTPYSNNPSTASGRRGFDVAGLGDSVSNATIWDANRRDISDAKAFGRYKFDAKMGLERSKLNLQNTALLQGAANDSAKIDLAKREQKANERNQNKAFGLQQSKLRSDNAYRNRALGLQDEQSQRQYALGNKELRIKNNESQYNYLLGRQKLGLEKINAKRNYGLSLQELAFKERDSQRKYSGYERAQIDSDLHNRRQAIVGMVGNFL